MNKELFIKYIDLVKQYKEQEDKLYEEFRLELYESTIGDIVGKLMDLCLDTSFTEAGSDLVLWWLYENVDKIIYNEDNTESDVTDINDLWDFMISNKDVYILK